MNSAPAAGTQRQKGARPRGASGDIVIAVGVAVAFTILVALALWFAAQAGFQAQAAWALAIAPVLALSVVGVVLAGLSRRHQEAEAAARAGEARYRLLAEHSTDMIVQGDLDTVQVYVSPACRELLGYQPHELIGTRALSGVHPDDLDAYRDTLVELTSGQVDRATSRQRYKRKDESWVWTEATLRLIRDDWGQPTGFIASVRDISERHALEEKLSAQARTDSLTGLNNRRAFEERLQEEWGRALRRRTSIALLSIDIDFFKQFNDHYGHSAGDYCLRQVAGILRQERRVSDFAARIGGEEFVIILPDTDTQGALAVAEAILSRLRFARIPHPQSPYGMVSVSIGVAAALAAALQGVADLLRASDAALYRAKQSGRNQVGVGDEFHPQG